MTLILPATGPCTGEFQVALIGLNMIAGPAFTIKISGVNRNEGIHFDRVYFTFHSFIDLILI